jgi:hypothetical protein
MNSEMAELRKILDMFEGAGFTVTYLRTRHPNYLPRRFEIAVKSSELDKFGFEATTAGEVVSLVEKNGYWVSLLNHCTDGIITEYEATIYLKITAGKKE